jgi:hypothetical protein
LPDVSGVPAVSAPGYLNRRLLRRSSRAGLTPAAAVGNPRPSRAPRGLFFESTDGGSRMSGAASTTTPGAPIPEFNQVMGHPKPLWMLFMTEFWERFAFYGIRWALVLYIVAQFHGGSATGEASANQTYGAYLALVYAGAIFGGYVADRVLGYQRSILLGAVIMAVGLFMISMPNPEVFKFGLATIIAGNGLFKPNISTMVGKLYSPTDERRDSGFTIFYMGINLGAMLAPIFTGWLASKVFGTDAMPAYKMVFIAAGVGMLISLVWFWFGPPPARRYRSPERRRRAQGPRAVHRHRRVGRDSADLLPALHQGDHAAVVRAVPDVRPAVRHDPDRRHQGGPGAARPRHRDADHLHLQHPVLDVLRAGRQLLHLPRREDRRQEHLRLRLPGGLVPVGELAGDHHVRAAHGVAVGEARQSESVDPRKFGLGLIFNGWPSCC